MLNNKPIGLPEEIWWKQLCKQSNLKQKNLEDFLRKCGFAYPYENLWNKPAKVLFGNANNDEIADAITMFNCCSIATWLFYMHSFAKFYNPKLGTVHNAVNASIQEFKKRTKLRYGFITPTCNDIKVYINSGVASPLDSAQLYPPDSMGNNFSGQSYITHLLSQKPTQIQNVDVTFLRNLVKRKVISEDSLKTSDVLVFIDGQTQSVKMNALDPMLPPYEVSSALRTLPQAAVEEHDGDAYLTLVDLYSANPDLYSSVVQQYLVNNMIDMSTPTAPVLQAVELPENIETMSGAELLESLSKSDVVTNSFGSGIRKYIQSYGIDDRITVRQLIEWDEQEDTSDLPKPSVTDSIDVISEYIEANNISYDVTYAGLSGYITDVSSGVPNTHKPTPKDTEYTSAGIRDIVDGFNSRNPDRKYTLLTNEELADLSKEKISYAYNRLDGLINSQINDIKLFLDSFQNSLQIIDSYHNKGELSDIEAIALKAKIQQRVTEIELNKLRDSLVEVKQPEPTMTGDVFSDACMYIFTEVGKWRHPNMTPQEYVAIAPLNLVTVRIASYDRDANRDDLFEFIERFKKDPDITPEGVAILDHVITMLKV